MASPELRRAIVAAGLGALAEELYLAHRAGELVQPYRRLRELRRRMLQEVEEETGEDVADVADSSPVGLGRSSSLLL